MRQSSIQVENFGVFQVGYYKGYSYHDKTIWKPSLANYISEVEAPEISGCHPNHQDYVLTG